MTLRSVAFLSLAFTFSISAQTPRPSFEVAVVRPVDKTTPPAPSAIRVTGQQFSFSRMSMRDLLERAYGISVSRIEGPAWSLDLRNTNYDIEAKLPAGATPSQVPLMLQKLLEERFKLVAHRGTKVTDFMALVVGKDGVKFKQSTPDPADFSMFDRSSDPVVFKSGSTKTTQGPNGLQSVEMSTLADVATLLDPHFGGLPVVDKTGLKGTYDLKLQYTLPDTVKAAAEGRMTKEFIADIREQSRAGVINGIEKLGLKVEKQRGEIEVLVIDHIEKVPTEN